MRNVGLCSLIRMMGCLKRMGMGGMGVMSCLFVLTCSVMGRRFLMMLHSLFVMLGGLGVMALRWMVPLRCFFRHSHVSSPFFALSYEARDLLSLP